MDLSAQIKVCNRNARKIQGIREWGEYPIRRIRTDGGTEYKGVFTQYLKERGIKHEVSAPYSPEQNGVSERVNRTIVERTKAILADSNLPKRLWMEIASTVVYLKNRSPTSAVKDMTPYEAWHKEKPDLSHLQIISTKAYVHVPKDLRKKLDFNAKTGVFVGYDGRNQYRIWDPAKQDVIVFRDVEFDETTTSTTKIDEQQSNGTDKVRTISATRESSPKPFEPEPFEPEPFEPKSDDEDIGDEN